MSFESSNLIKLIFYRIFHCDIKEQYKIKKMSPGFLFLILDLEKIIFLCFLCHGKEKKKAVIFI